MSQRTRVPPAGPPLGTGASGGGGSHRGRQSGGWARPYLFTGSLLSGFIFLPLLTQTERALILTVGIQFDEFSKILYPLDSFIQKRPKTARHSKCFSWLNMGHSLPFPKEGSISEG